MVIGLLLLPQRYVFSSKSQLYVLRYEESGVVIATTKVRIFKQITTTSTNLGLCLVLLLLPQRYVFSSKSQRVSPIDFETYSCYCYHKGTYFQANHNSAEASTASSAVVIATTKVRIFKQITTDFMPSVKKNPLLLLPQRYVFSSKSQLRCNLKEPTAGCYCYHKGTYFQANHNCCEGIFKSLFVVIATTKVRIFKQITTSMQMVSYHLMLLLLPQRYVFSSKSQQTELRLETNSCCYCYHKGTYFQANHN